MAKEAYNEILLLLALKEDIGRGDVTSQALEIRGKKGCGVVKARSAGVLSGLVPFKKVFKYLSPSISFEQLKKDGETVGPGQRVIVVKGPLDCILAGERTALNILGHLSGVATLTRKFVEAVKSFKPYGRLDAKVAILDTRKTMPGIRRWEKDAVRHGGGSNHRMGLYDMYLIKDNHITAVGGVEKALKLVRRQRRKSRAKIEVEVKNLAELRKALSFRPDFLLLDNFTPARLKRAVLLAREIDPTVILEASGNVSLKTVRKIAATGIDRISVGMLTHSAPALNFTFQVANNK